MVGRQETRSSLDALSADEQAEQLRQVGNYYFKKGRFDAAIEAYTEAITLCPNVIVYWTNRALCHRKKNDWVKLDEDCRRAIQLDKKSVKAHYMLGLALLEKEKYGEGVKELEKALDIGRGTDPEGYIVEEIWQEFTKAKYLKWEQESVKRSRELQNLKETCLLALKQKHAMDSLLNLGFTNVTSMSNQEEIEALGHVFKEVAEIDLPGEIPDYLCCKITFDVFRDPVITPSGITYERKALMNHLEKVGHFDPATRLTLYPCQLRPNLAIKEAVQAFLDLHGWAYKAQDD
ncbi:unnamed protein product [Rhodiola kirilowii]